jgi:hypothetical protein
MTKKEELIEAFEYAFENKSKYMFLEMALPLHPATELIINPIENLQQKLEYLLHVYDDELIGLHAPVQIISFGCVDNLSQLEYARNNSEVN